jgi:hypothetical protein
VNPGRRDRFGEVLEEPECPAPEADRRSSDTPSLEDPSVTRHLHIVRPPDAVMPKVKALRSIAVLRRELQRPRRGEAAS